MAMPQLGHDPTNFFTKFIISRPKDNIININLANKDIISIYLNEESRISFAYFKTILEKKILKTFIPCSRSLLKPIERLMELVYMVEEVCDRTAQNNSVLSPKPVHVSIKQ
jgi:hypothetical protein